MNNFGCIQIRTRNCLVRSTNVTSVPCRPPASLCIVQKEFLLRNFFSRRFADFLTGRKTCCVGHAMAIFLVKWVEEVRSRPIGNLSRVFFNWSVKSLSFQSRIGIKEKKETTRWRKKTGLDWDQIKTSASKASDWPRTELFSVKQSFLDPERFIAPVANVCSWLHWQLYA